MGDIQFFEEVGKEEWQKLLILQKAQMAQRDGYFTKQDIQDIQIAFKLTVEINNGNY